VNYRNVPVSHASVQLTFLRTNGKDVPLFSLIDYTNERGWQCMFVKDEEATTMDDKIV
jgi:hypothetical protein